MGDSLDQLRALLAAERQALLRGEFDIEGNAEKKQVLVEQIARLRPDAMRLDLLRNDAQRTMRLLAAALSGLRATERRLGTLGDAPQLRTYGSNGRAHEASFAQGGTSLRK